MSAIQRLLMTGSPVSATTHQIKEILVRFIGPVALQNIFVASGAELKCWASKKKVCHTKAANSRQNIELGNSRRRLR